jgi:NADP-dependent 3-hydroxy acid dehydrogenase YdfG
MGNSPFLDQVAVVTGASSGIGESTALALARAGAHVALAARRDALLARVADQIGALGREALVLPTDVTDQAQVEHMIRAVVERWGRIDLLVSNAGEYVRTPVENLTVETIQQSMAVNYYGGVYAILAALPYMRAQNKGHIVVVTSMDGKKGVPPDAPYVSAKFALTGFAEVLRQELHGSGIYVTNVLPGRVDTAMIEQLNFHWISGKISADAVAQAILNGIQKRRPEVIVPFQAYFLYFLNVISPRLGDWAVRSFRLDGWDGDKPE